jgi:hypothetical protein
MRVPAGPELRDIHLPPPPGWWPPAPGWWVLAALLSIVIVGATVLWRRHMRRHHYVDAVMVELDALAARHAIDADHSALAAGISQLLRRVARQHDPDAVHLRGGAWQTLLQSLAPKVDVTRLVALDEIIYRRDLPVDATEVVAAAKAWLRVPLSRKHASMKALLVAGDAREGKAHA